MSGFERPALEQDGVILKTQGGPSYNLGKDKDIAEFRYMEDMNMGYPVLEIVIPEAVYQKLNAGLIGNDELIVKGLKYDKFKIDGHFRVKAIGVATPIMNKPGHVNFIKLICHHMDQERLMNLDKTITCKSCALERRVSEVVELAHSEADCKLKSVVEKTEKLQNFSRWNLYIPSVMDAQKVIRKMTHSAMNTAKRGGYLYFYNRDEMHFETAERVMKNKYKGGEIKIVEGRNDYIPYEIALSPFNDFPAITLGNKKRIYMYRYTIKEPWYFDATNMMTYPGLHANKITQLQSNAGKGMRAYITHCDNEDEVKAFAESMYLSQIFNINLDLKMMVNRCANFKIGQVIPIQFLNATAEQELLHNMSDQWLIKSLTFKYTMHAVNLDLKLIRAGINHKAGKFAPA